MQYSKQERVNHVNDLIIAIGSVGRQFFYHAPKDRFAKFELNQCGQVFFRDDYTDKLVYVCYRHRWRSFSHGGTLRDLVEKMRDYIRFEQTIPMGYFGLKPSFCDQDVWGYGEDAVNQLREQIKQSPVIKEVVVNE